MSKPFLQKRSRDAGSGNGFVKKPSPKVVPVGRTDRTVFTLGMKNEVIPYDFTEMGWDAKDIVEELYAAAYKELMTRSLDCLWDWSIRTKNMFDANGIIYVGMIIHMTVEDVNTLKGCGFKARKEVYESCKYCGIELPAWKPEHYWDKFMNSAALRRKEVLRKIDEYEDR